MFKSRLVIISIITALLIGVTGCAGIGVNEVATVESETVEVQMQYVDGSQVGPLYDVSVTVPPDWVGNFETRNEGNALYFDYIGESERPAQVFFIEALSTGQYWDQSGSHPGSYVNIVNEGDTYFTYHLPVDFYYSGLSAEEFTVLAEAVPQVVASFTSEEAE